MRRGTPAAIAFGEFLRDIRICKKMTMRHVASVLGVPAATISRVEKAQRALKEDKISKWAAALEIDEKKLLSVWLTCQEAEPDPPIVRKRSTSVTRNDLCILISSLSSTNRNRVQGYVEALIEQEREGSNEQSQ